MLFANLIGVHPFESLRVDAFTAQCVLTYLTPLLAFDVVAGVLVPRALAAQGSDAEGAVDEYRDLFAKARERAGSPAERGAEALQRLTLLAPEGGRSIARLALQESVVADCIDAIRMSEFLRDKTEARAAVAAALSSQELPPDVKEATNDVIETTAFSRAEVLAALGETPESAEGSGRGFVWRMLLQLDQYDAASLGTKALRFQADKNTFTRLGYTLLSEVSSSLATFGLVVGGFAAAADALAQAATGDTGVLEVGAAAVAAGAGGGATAAAGALPEVSMPALPALPSRADVLNFALLGGGAGVTVGPMGIEIEPAVVAAAPEAAEAASAAASAVAAAPAGAGADVLNFALLGGGAGVTAGPMGIEIEPAVVAAAPEAAEAASAAASAVAAAPAGAGAGAAQGVEDVIEVDAGLLAAETLLAVMTVFEVGGGLDLNAMPGEDNPEHLDQIMEYSKYNLAGSLAGAPIEESRGQVTTTTSEPVEFKTDEAGNAGLADLGTQIGAWWWEYLSRGLVPRADFVSAFNLRMAIKIACMGLAFIDTEFNLLAPVAVGFLAEVLLREASAQRTREAVPRRLYFEGGGVYEGPLVAGAPQGVGLYSNCGATAPRTRVVSGRAALTGIGLLLRAAELRYVGEWVRGVPDGVGAAQGGQDISFVWAAIAAAAGERDIETAIRSSTDTRNGEADVSDANEDEERYFVRGLYDGRWRGGQPSQGVCTLARFPGAGPMGETAPALVEAAAKGDEAALTKAQMDAVPYVAATLAGDFPDGIFRSGVITLTPKPLADDGEGVSAAGAVIDEYHVTLLDPPKPCAGGDTPRKRLRAACRVSAPPCEGLDRRFARALARCRAAGARLRRDATTGEVIDVYVGEFVGLRAQGFGAEGTSLEAIRAWVDADGAPSGGAALSAVAASAPRPTSADDAAALGFESEASARGSIALAASMDTEPPTGTATVEVGRFQEDALSGTAGPRELLATVKSALARADAAEAAAGSAREASVEAQAYARGREKVAELNL